MTHHDSSNMILARRKLRLLYSQTDLKVAHQDPFPSAEKISYMMVYVVLISSRDPPKK